MNHYFISFIGGCLIGLSAALMMYFLGRISGISGILWNAIKLNLRRERSNADNSWQWLFIAGLPAGAFLAHWLFEIAPKTGPASNTLLTILAGLLVGIGTKLGSGCTSGHGVCGISRISPRSLAATAVFISTGIATVFVVTRIGDWL